MCLGLAWDYTFVVVLVLLVIELFRCSISIIKTWGMTGNSFSLL